MKYNFGVHVEEGVPGGACGSTRSKTGARSKRSPMCLCRVVHNAHGAASGSIPQQPGPEATPDDTKVTGPSTLGTSSETPPSYKQVVSPEEQEHGGRVTLKKYNPGGRVE
ncbi:hypothetical protein K438DRAFT_2023033 [Mycena galopus ATCC 62051]|nr:hypothetical protein K438DRAFT_2023033 [Mycena galopus ATCC 62051]